MRSLPHWHPLWKPRTRGRRSNCGCAATAGVFEWFIPSELGGQQWHEADLLRGYLKLAAACLTTTFVITQHGAMQRIAAGESSAAATNCCPI